VNKVTIVNYGSGNLLSVSRGLEHSGGTVVITDNPDQVAAAERLVVPGVGAFAKAMQALLDRGLVEPIHRFIKTGRPFLGICVGMQLMMDYSEEFGRHYGLGLIPGRVGIIPETAADGTPHPIPHIGWKRLLNGNANWKGSILKNAGANASVYFVHSFQAVPDDDDHVLGVCDYNGRTITAAVRKDNLVGCQFHPEKSGPVGLTILNNFLHAA
jgi:glutamine amidotransferase